jgi:hypothetical protein
LWARGLIPSRNGKKTVVSFNATTFDDLVRNLQGVIAAAPNVTERNHIEPSTHQRLEGGW